MNKDIKKISNDFEVIKNPKIIIPANELGYQQGKESSSKILGWSIIGFGIFLVIYIIYSTWEFIKMSMK